MTVSKETREDSAAHLSVAALREMVLRGLQAVRLSAETVATAIASGSGTVAEKIRTYEEDLDALDRQVNEGVTASIVHVSEAEARELLAYLKLIIDLERISDLLLNVANRLETVASRLAAEDLKDLGTMASTVTHMIGDVSDAFVRRELEPALLVLREDAELDRLRNMIFVRHVDNPEREPRREGFHLVFMAQTLERCGDHAKNLAEEICHLITGRSMRHILREHDRPLEELFLERMRSNLPPRKAAAKSAKPAE
jgi:phosphate transport system protein